MNGPFFPFYASRNVLLDLTPYMEEAEFDESKYPASILSAYNYENKQYGGPFYYDTIALYYNKNLFDAAGIPYPDASWDWNKLREVSQQLTEAPNQYGFVSWWNSQEQTYNFIFSNGGEVVADNKCRIAEPPAVEAVQYLVDLIYKDKVSQEPAAMGDDPTTFFQQGKAAMITSGSWNVNAYKESITGFEWDVAPLPKAPTGESVSVISGLGNVASAQTEHPAEAFAWINFIASEEGQRIISENGQPATYTGLAKPWQDANPDVNTQVFIDAAANAHEFPSGVTFEQWSPVLNTIMSDIFAGRTPVQEGLTQACQQIDPILQGQQ
jgi:multiple sugar transport system substrate-binding protein